MGKGVQCDGKGKEVVGMGKGVSGEGVRLGMDVAGVGVSQHEMHDIIKDEK